MMQKYLQSRGRFEAMRKQYNEFDEEVEKVKRDLDAQLRERRAELLESERLTAILFDEATKERILETVRASSEGRISFVQLRDIYCTEAMSFEDFEPLSRRHLMGYVRELEAAWRIRGSVEYADGKKTLVIYPV